MITSFIKINFKLCYNYYDCKIQIYQIYTHINIIYKAMYLLYMKCICLNMYDKDSSYTILT